METVEVKEETTITIRPVKKGSWLPEGHDGHYKFTGCATDLVPFINPDTREYLTGLDDSDEKEFESKLKLSPGSLNRYTGDFWKTYHILIPKDGKTFNLKNPKDDLAVRVLKANPKVAVSKADLLEKPTALFLLASDTEEAKIKNVNDKFERSAIKRYGQLNIEEMLNVLRVYSHTGKSLSRLNMTSSKDLIESTLYDKVKEDPEQFLSIVNDPMFKYKVILDKFLTERVVIRSGSQYLINGGDRIGVTLEETLNFLSDDRNQDVLISLKAKLQEKDSK